MQALGLEQITQVKSRAAIKMKNSILQDSLQTNPEDKRRLVLMLHKNCQVEGSVMEPLLTFLMVRLVVLEARPSKSLNWKVHLELT